MVLFALRHNLPPDVLAEMFGCGSTTVQCYQEELEALIDEVLRRCPGGLRCVTIHKFQGSERDIMVISPVGAQGIPDSTRGWLVHQTNLWNVAITRARSQLVVVGDRSWWSGQVGLLTALAIGQEPAGQAPDGVLGPADRLHLALRETDFAVQRDVALSGHTADLVVRQGSAEVAVFVDDPDGNPDGRGLRTVLAHLDIIGARTSVRRLPAWRCLAEPDRVVAELSEELHRLHATRPNENG